MNIMSAIYTGQSGLMKAKASMDVRASRIAESGFNESSQETLAEDLVGMEIDKAAVKANGRSISVSNDIFQGLLTIGKK